MYQPRFLSPSAEVSASVYHCISRVIDRRFVLGREERDVFVRMMREYEAFCGVRVLAYCVMSNHFHLLVEVPPKKKGEPVPMDDTEFLRRIKPLYSKVYFRDIEQMLERFRGEGADKAAEELKAKYTRRMHDLSLFMKGLKQRFTQWYNGANGRRGTLWEGRFKSVLVEHGYAARVMCAYIDLNPVRAGMVAKPEDYRWSSYGEAMQPMAKRGRSVARKNYRRVLNATPHPLDGTAQGESRSWSGGLAEFYRMMLYSDGEEVFVDPAFAGGRAGETAAGKPQLLRKGFKQAQVEKVLKNGGRLSVGEALRCRLRYLADGVAFGSKDFVEKVFRGARERFGEKRKSGARTLRGVGWRQKKTRLYNMRELRKEVLGVSSVEQ